MLVRRKNKDYRSREHLTVGEVNQLLEIAKGYKSRNIFIFPYPLHN
jgi:hypothetical protein